MAEINYRVTVEAPADRVWEVLSDFGNIQAYSPTVLESHLTSDQTAGAGTSRHCDLVFAGATVEERILDWEDGREYSLEMFDGAKRPPFAWSRATFRVEPDGDRRTTAVADMRYELKWGPAGTLMDRAMVAPRLDAAIADLLAGLKHHVETSEPVTPETDLTRERAAVVAG